MSRRPEVALIATGDELVTPTGEDLAARPDRRLQQLRVEGAGGGRGRPRSGLLPIARDDRESLAQVLRLAEGADLIVTIGGASVGDHDLVGEVAAAMGLERAFYKVAMRPGKPLMAGRIGAAALLGLPRQPRCRPMVCGHLFLVPMLRAMMGLPHGRAAAADGRGWAANLPRNGPRAHYMRADLMPGNDFPEITPYGSQDSALLSVLSQANALLVRPPHDEPRQAGALVA